VVCQFYPETPPQLTMIKKAAMTCGFTGGIVIDYPNSTKAKKCELRASAAPPVFASGSLFGLPCRSITLARHACGLPAVLARLALLHAFREWVLRTIAHLALPALNP
jgi:hypothetical protein